MVKQQVKVSWQILLYVTFPPPKSEIFAHDNTGVEGLDTEVHGAVDIAQVRQLDPGVEGGGSEVGQWWGWGEEMEVFKE